MGTRGNHHYVLEVSERKSSKMVIPPHVAVEEGGGHALESLSILFSSEAINPPTW